MIDEPTREQSSLAGETMKLCLNYVSYVYFADPPNQQESSVRTNGSCTFIDTGSRRFAVTNHHVIEAFREKRQVSPDLNFQIGSDVIDIETRIIAESKFHDLATFTVTNNEMEIFQKQFCFCRDWPIQRAVAGEPVFLAGYQGIFREQETKARVKFQSVLLTELVASSSSNQFVIVLDKENWKKQFGPRDVPELTSLGGFSGSGAFRLVEKSRITTLELMGIIFEGGDQYGIQLVRHIDFIHADGSIN